jgi:uncharacterized protein
MLGDGSRPEKRRRHTADTPETIGTGLPKTRRLTLQWLTSITDISRESWDTLAHRADTPFLEWEWLALLEESGSIGIETGWQPCHCTLRDGDTLVAAAPLYIKWHSTGEFVWDYIWADVAEQLKVDYYPKLVGMSPATPSVGYRFLFRDDEDEQVLSRLMLEQIELLCSRNKISGSAFNFVDPAWFPYPEEYGYVPWKHQSYLWRNHGYETFQDYLTRFRKNQRRNIRRERASMQKQGISVQMIPAEAAPDRYFDIMWELYEKTNDQFGPWAAKYLNRKFFTGLTERFRHRILLSCAYEGFDGIVPGDRDPIAMAFLVVKDDLIVGRYWGTFRQVRDLHFNVCYYAPIEWAIEHGVTRFDPGAGSPHKLRRGFEAVDNYSLHNFVDPTMNLVMQTHIENINQGEQEKIDQMNTSIPWKRDGRVNDGSTIEGIDTTESFDLES